MKYIIKLNKVTISKGVCRAAKWYNVVGWNDDATALHCFSGKQTNECG